MTKIKTSCENNDQHIDAEPCWIPDPDYSGTWYLQSIQGWHKILDSGEPFSRWEVYIYRIQTIPEYPELGSHRDVRFFQFFYTLPTCLRSKDTIKPLDIVEITTWEETP